jgi:hypothetical protein
MRRKKDEFTGAPLLKQKSGPLRMLRALTFLDNVRTGQSDFDLEQLIIIFAMLP